MILSNVIVNLLISEKTLNLFFQLLPEAEFHLVPDGGHSTKEKGLEQKLVEATDKYKYL